MTQHPLRARITSLAALATLALLATACDEQAAEAPGATAWFLLHDAEAQVFELALVDPRSPQQLLAHHELDDLTDLVAASGRAANWGDVEVDRHAGRVFANAQSLDAVAVFEAATGELEAVLPVGGRPTHIYNPNGIGELWTHADTEGSFYIIDPDSLEVSEPLVAALQDTGHGKLLYAPEMGSRYYATNTNDPGVFPIDGATRTCEPMIPLCGVPCPDDPDETCGSTHDKIYNPALDWALFQCAGAAFGHYAVVEAATDQVVHDLLPLVGSVAHTPGFEYILLLDARAAEGDVKIWDTTAPGHDGLSFEAELTIGGEPSARGVSFHQGPSGDWEAFIPQTAGSQVAIVNLRTHQVEFVEVGPLTRPEGASHFSRRAAVGGGHLFTYDDAGVVLIDLETREVTRGPALPGRVSRVLVVEPPR